MQKAQWRVWSLGAAATLLLHLANCVDARPTPDGRPVPLAVSIFNDAHVPASVLAQARERATAVFAEAGVELTWLDCGTPGHRTPNIGCADIAYPTHFAIRLVRSGVGVPEDAYGQSFQNEEGQGNYANVYVAPLASSKALSVIREGDLMGCVIAHEAGHLLLGVRSHSGSGLMRGFWRVEELYQAANGKLGFSLAETEKIRARYSAKGGDARVGD